MSARPWHIGAPSARPGEEHAEKRRKRCRIGDRLVQLFTDVRVVRHVSSRVHGPSGPEARATRSGYEYCVVVSLYIVAHSQEHRMIAELSRDHVMYFDKIGEASPLPRAPEACLGKAERSVRCVSRH